MGLGDSYALVVIGRSLTGAGAVLLNVLLTKMVADWFAGREIVTAMAILVSSWPFGISLGLLSLGPLALAASWPLVMVFLSVIMFVFQPVTNGYSRYMERRADAYAMKMSEVDGETAAPSFDKLAAFNLSDPDPHPVIEFWFYSHPALAERMAFVRNWEK